MTRKRANIMLICAQPGEQRALKYDPEMCWRVRDMAQEGMFPEEWCADLGVTMSTLFQRAHDQAITVAICSAEHIPTSSLSFARIPPA